MGERVVGLALQTNCRQKATLCIIEGDIKASSLQGCQCQEAEPGWEQRAPPCLPLQRAVTYIVNTLSVFVSISNSVLFFFGGVVFCYAHSDQLFVLSYYSPVMLNSASSDISSDRNER